MKDYAQLATKIVSSVWLITPEGLSVVLDIAQKRMNGESFSDDYANEIALHSKLLDEGMTGAGPEVINGVGILPINGPIFGKANLMTQLSGATSLEMIQQDLRAMLEDDSIHTILMDMDTPGGTNNLLKEVGDEIYAGRDIKPIYALADEMIGSAGLWLASQASAVYSVHSGSVGSLGAYTVHEDQSGADAKQGRKFTFTSAGRFKTEGNPHEPLSQEAKEYRQEVINDVYGEFVDAVARGRGSTSELVEASYGGGRMLTSKKALEVGMIDGIMPREQLMSQLAAPKSQHVSISINGSQIAATMFENKIELGMTTDDAGNIKLEAKEWEHSQPGTGSPPTPRRDEDGSDDKAIVGGWRKDPLPKEQVGSVTQPVNHNVRGEKMPDEDTTTTVPVSLISNEDAQELIQLLGVSDAQAALEAVRTMHTEHNAFQNSVALANEEMEFKTKFPQMYEEHIGLLKDKRANRAKLFATSVSRISTLDGDKPKATQFGLSAIALSTIEEAHIRFSAGTATVDDFEAALSAALNGGAVDYGESGSSQENQPAVIDTSTQQGLKNARALFAEKVAEVKTENPELDHNGAVSEAALRWPDIAAAYRLASPA